MIDKGNIYFLSISANTKEKLWNIHLVIKKNELFSCIIDMKKRENFIIVMLFYL